ncbi:carbamate kinase [Flavonifractor sp. An112]|uniref:carbamate kinase n=1 Tax=Flavonifractor sp. An112 TaxID=1965544 RepID=UPI00174B9B17|nr:carbamate kinase [Flavonifractor sp. An112]
MKKRIVVALGGNALGNTLPEQLEAVKYTSRILADLIAEGNEIVIFHGNGPQVGMINLAMSELHRADPRQSIIPMSVCVAMSQGYIGYDLQSFLHAELLKRGIDKPVTTVITQTRVDPDDPAFQHPTKPIGRFLSLEEAKELEKEGYRFMEDAGRGYRRVVASPKPQEIMEIDTIRTLLQAGQVVVAAGGGGIPVVRQGCYLRGVGAVVDKDFASCVLAKSLDADELIIFTAVEKVAIHFGKPDQVWLDRLTPDQAAKYVADGEFAAGSMLPKVQAAMDFAASKPGRRALITLLEKAGDALNGLTGTVIAQ